MYQIASAEPAWLELFPGVKAQFRPIGRAAVRAGRLAMRKVLDADPEDRVAALDALSDELLRRGLAGWEGVAGPDGQPLAFDAAGVEAFVADATLSAAADEVYVQPWLLREAEKNASAGSPPGTSAGRTAGRPTARTATKPAPTAHTKSTARKATTRR